MRHRSRTRARTGPSLPRCRTNRCLLVLPLCVIGCQRRGRRQASQSGKSVLSECVLLIVSVNAVSRASSGFCLAAEVAGWRNGCSVSGINDYIREWVRRGGLERDFYAWIGRPVFAFFSLVSRACKFPCPCLPSHLSRWHRQGV